jgi:hypothetical protein
MDYTPGQIKNYIKQPGQAYTFDQDDKLPKLPVPTLEQTLKKYIKSVKPFVNETEFEKTQKFCQEFQSNGEGEKCQRLLLQRAQVS